MVPGQGTCTLSEPRTIWPIDRFNSAVLHWLLISFGAILRIAQFVYNRSLTEGEAPLALNILERSYAELLKPLDYVQAAPVGFLMVEKFLTSLFGTSEYALRLFPLITGIMALFLFLIVAKKHSAVRLSLLPYFSLLLEIISSISHLK